MRTIQIIPFFILGFLAANTLMGQQKLSLNQCISSAIENNVTLKQFEIQEKLSAETLNQAKRNLLPGVSASSNAGVSFGRSIDPNSNDIVNTEFFNNSYDLDASVTVFNGFRLMNRIQYEEFRKQAASYNHLNAIDDLAFNVMTSYFDVLYYKGMIEIAKKQVETSKLSLKAIEKNVELGTKAKTDLLEMQANLGTEELRLIQMENSMENALLTLRQYMNSTTEEGFDLVNENCSVVSEKLPDHQNLFDGFTEWSPQFQSFVASLKASEKNLAINRSLLYPALTAGAGIGSGYYETYKDDNGNVISFSDQLKNNKNQYIGASLSIPIFNRWANRSNIKLAKLEVEQAKSRMEAEKQRLYFQMANTLNSLEALGREYSKLEKQKETEQLAFQAAQKKLEQGIISVIDFYVAKNRLANSNSQVLRAKLQWEIQRKTLDFYMGKRFWE